MNSFPSLVAWITTPRELRRTRRFCQRLKSNCAKEFGPLVTARIARLTATRICRSGPIAGTGMAIEGTNTIPRRATNLARWPRRERPEPPGDFIMKRIMGFISHFIFGCDGPVIGEGFVLDPKNNHGRTILRGWRRIHKCDFCGEPFSHDNCDLLDPNATLRNETSNQN